MFGLNETSLGTRGVIVSTTLMKLGTDYAAVGSVLILFDVRRCAPFYGLTNTATLLRCRVPIRVPLRDFDLCLFWIEFSLARY